MARPKITRLDTNPKVGDKIVRAIQEGMSLHDAALLGGVDQETVRRWRKRPGKVYREFDQRIEVARIEGKAAKISRINRIGMEGNWKALQWLLTCQFPDEFSERKVLRIGNEGEGGFRIDQFLEANDPTPDQLVKLIGVLRSIADGVSEDESG
jgi:hypothetical protein